MVPGQVVRTVLIGVELGPTLYSTGSLVNIRRLNVLHPN